jgi:hypothetical protein
MNAPLFAVRSKRFHDWLLPDRHSWSAIEHRRGTWPYAEAREIAANHNGYAIPINDEEGDQ